jgi:S-formylglutathione hydrolase FrmB
MRRRPDSITGTMELLVVRSVEQARERGGAMLSLSLSALASVEEPGGDRSAASASEESAAASARLAREAAQANRAREFLSDHLARFYDFRGLFRWKKKFNPEFEDRFLVYPDRFALPQVALALVRAQSPGGGLLSYLRNRAPLPPAARAEATATTAGLAAAPGSVLRLTMPAPTLGDPSRTVRVCLPPSYDRPEAAGRRYPTVYLLHGWPGSQDKWFDSGHVAEVAAALRTSGEIPELILVCPNGNGRGLLNRTLYMNSQDGRVRMEDYIAHDLVAWTDATFRTCPAAASRAVIGISDGATAALNMVFHHADVFGACGGHSGQYLLRKAFAAAPMLGPEPGASRLLASYSPALQAASVAPRLAGITIYFDCGTGDGDIGDNRDFHRTLESLGVRHTYREFPGSHSWDYWRMHLFDSLRAVAAGIK